MKFELHMKPNFTNGDANNYFPRKFNQINLLSIQMYRKPLDTT